MASEYELNNSDDVTLDEISLESILAEYKGSAYINGDKKTPPELLNNQTEKILREALGNTAPDTLLSTVNTVLEEDTYTDTASAPTPEYIQPEFAAPEYIDRKSVV